MPTSTAATWNQIRRFWGEIALLVLCIVYGTILFAQDHRATLEISTDVIEYLEASQHLGDYSSPFHGPGYSAAVYLAAQALPGQPLYVVGRLVSSLAALYTVAATYALGRRLWGSQAAGLLAAIAAIFNAQFWLSATWGLSDALGMAFMMVGALCLWRARQGDRWAAGWAGLAAGAGYLTRYISGWTLVGVALLVFLIQPKRILYRIRDALLFIIGFLIPAGPWLERSFRLYDSPFYTQQHLNLAAKLLGQEMREDVLALAQRFPTMFSVIAQEPLGVLRSWLVSLEGMPAEIWKQSPFVAILVLAALPALVVDIVRRRRTGSQYLFVATLMIVAYTALVALGQSHPRYLLPLFPLLALYIGKLYQLVAEAVQGRPALSVARLRFPMAGAVGLLAAVILVAGALWAAPLVSAQVEFMDRVVVEPYEYGEIAACLKADALSTDIVLSTAPHIPFLAGLKAVDPGQRALQGLADIDGLMALLRKYRANYFVVESRLGPWRLDNLSYLLKPLQTNPNVIPALVPVCVYTDPRAVVYRINRFEIEGDPPAVNKPSYGPVTWAGPYRLGEDIELVGYTLPGGALKPGAKYEVMLYWRVLRDVTANYQVFVHLSDLKDQTISQQDGTPQSGKLPTSLWKRGSIVVDRHVLPLPADLPKGGYQLFVGMYDLSTMERQTAIRQPSGERVKDDRIFLQRIARIE